jgi:hypothetical protein
MLFHNRSGDEILAYKSPGRANAAANQRALELKIHAQAAKFRFALAFSAT